MNAVLPDLLKDTAEREDVDYDYTQRLRVESERALLSCPPDQDSALFADLTEGRSKTAAAAESPVVE